MAASHANDLLYLDGLIEQLRKRAEDVNTFWLKSIGERIREMKGMDPSDKAGIDAIRNDTTLLADLEDAIRNLGQDTVQDAKAMLSIAARLSLEASPVAKGLPLESWISGVAEATHGRLKNIANTSVVGVVTQSGFMTPGDAYKAMIDEAAAQMASGKMGLNAAVRSVLKQFADSGLAVVEYESGRTRSLAAAIEMNLKEATSQVYQGVQRRVGQEFGADGVEISAHGDCAPDHLDIQGRQFTLEKYEKLNNSLSRPIGTLNCRHTIYTIIIGVSEPTYSDEELAEMRAKSLAVQEFDGKQMTTYEASQMQRRLEREIRKQKNRSVIAKAAGDDEMRREAQMKINQLTGKYKDLSDAFGLKTKAERMAVSEYRPVKANLLISPKYSGAKITDNYSKEAEKFAEMFYNEIRLMKNDVKQIAENLGEDPETISKIKQYLFIDKSYFNEDTGKYERFAPDCAIAQSWQRLFIGKDIKPHDKTLINHEKLEMEIKKQNPDISHSEAHAKAKSEYNYEDEADAYYGSLKKHSKNR